MNVIPLLHYQEVLWAVSARVGAEEALFLLDTAAGLTVLDRGLADRLGVRTGDRFSGKRMTGEVVQCDLTSDVEISLGERTILHQTVGILELASMLPPAWPSVGGALGLPTFEHMRVTIDFARASLVLDSDPAPDAREIRSRTRRDGPARDLFAEVRAGEGSFWFEIDTGNTGPVIVSPATAGALGLQGGKAATELDLAGLGPVMTDVVVKDIRYDGNLGAPFFGARPLTLDLASGRAWIEARGTEPQQKSAGR